MSKLNIGVNQSQLNKSFTDISTDDSIRAYANYLKKYGYAQSTTLQYCNSTAHFIHWISLQNLQLSQINETIIQQFLDDHLPQCQCLIQYPRARHIMSAALTHYLAMLRLTGACPQRSPLDTLVVYEELSDFNRYLLQVCGLAHSTCTSRLRHARVFLVTHFSTNNPIKISTLTPTDITNFVTHYSQKLTPTSIKGLCTSLIGYLSREYIEAILNAPDPSSWIGQRDRVMLSTLYNTGAHVSELISMRVADLVLEPNAWVSIHGKGRKERTVPLWPETSRELKRWLQQYPRKIDEPLFPGRSGAALTRVGFSDRLTRAVHGASQQFPELLTRQIFPHMIRHSVAMHMLQSGIDITVIALWLGHESPATTHSYVEADLQMKERALKVLQSPAQTPMRYRPTDDTLRFLQSL